MFVIDCPKCERQINLPETSRGKRVRCMGCQEIVLAVIGTAARPVDAPIVAIAGRGHAAAHAGNAGI